MPKVSQTIMSPASGECKGVEMLAGFVD